MAKLVFGLRGGATLRHHKAVELYHTRVSPVNPDKGRITRTGIATESCENFFLPALKKKREGTP